MVIKHKFVLVAALAATMTLPAAVQAIGLNIEIGDRGYYNHGARYWDNDWEYIWIPGHRSHGRWIHGYYRKGEHRGHRGDRHRGHDRDRDYDRGGR